MFSRYFGNRYFAVRFWPDFGAEIVTVNAEADYVVMVPAFMDTVMVPAFPEVIPT